MQLHFFKYQGTGNDFILLDNREENITLSTEQVAFLCNRRFGIGADGLMLLEKHTDSDFRMVYYNSDGKESSMCGNGGRCITAFAKRLGIVQHEAQFLAVDGFHEAIIDDNEIVSLQMIDVPEMDLSKDVAILNTGSPHYVQWVEDVAQVDVQNLGRSIRNEKRFEPGGINVNFIQMLENILKVRTYERGVEDETLSCGTGVTAAAIASTRDKTGDFTVAVEAPGGNLEVSFSKLQPYAATKVMLKGPAVFVYEGDITI